MTQKVAILNSLKGVLNKHNKKIFFSSKYVEYYAVKKGFSSFKDYFLHLNL